MNSLLGATQSVCPDCRALVPAKVIGQGQEVYFHKFCPSHGESKAFVHSNREVYLVSQRYVKPAWVPKAFGGDSHKACPSGCGFCTRHEQHLCMPIIEITSRCNLRCPVCINASGEQQVDLSLEDYRRMLDRLIAAEGQIDVLNLSGGEPLLHPQLFPLLDETLHRPEIIRVSISTNGLLFLEKPSLVSELHKRNIVVSLQLDGFNEAALKTLRGTSLVKEKKAILEILEREDISTTLTYTMAQGVNDQDLRPVLDLLFEKPHILSLMIQPMSYAGRASQFVSSSKRLSIPDVIDRLHDAKHPSVHREDFVPLPCSHPLCFSLSFYLMLNDAKALAINQMIEVGNYMDMLSNRVVFGLAQDEHEKMKALIYDLWSGPVGSVPESKEILSTIKKILKDMSGLSCGCFDARKVFTVAERKIKSIFIHAFQDVNNFDLARARRCCQAYPQSDGGLMPVCIRNVFHLKKPK